MSPGYTACAVRDRNLPLTKAEISVKTVRQAGWRMSKDVRVQALIAERRQKAQVASVRTDLVVRHQEIPHAQAR